MRDEILSDVKRVRDVLVAAMERAEIPAHGTQLSLFPLAFRHGTETCDALTALISAECHRHATIAARSFCEMAIECLWASREPDGVWRALKSALADERDQWNEVVREAPSLPPEGLPLARSVVGQLDDLERSVGIPAGTKNVPNVRQMIEAIHLRDRAEGLRQHDGAMSAALHYVVGYRFACGATHANLVSFILGSRETHLRGVRAMLASAAVSMCRALKYGGGLNMDDLTRAAAEVMTSRKR